MAKHPQDTQTAELPAIPSPVRRGRPPKGDKPMTPAERKAASRKAAREAGFKAIQLDAVDGYLPVQLSCQVSDLTRIRLNKAAKARGLTVGQLLDQLCADLDA